MTQQIHTEQPQLQQSCSSAFCMCLLHIYSTKMADGEIPMEIDPIRVKILIDHPVFFSNSKQSASMTKLSAWQSCQQ